MPKLKKRKMNFLLSEPMCRTLEAFAETESEKYGLTVTVSDVLRKAVHDMVFEDADLKAAYETYMEVWKDAR